MKVILNQDVKHLGEEGDVKDVANGYARNYLFPRNFAVPCNELTLAHFESRKAEIEAKKVLKRENASSLKEKLEATTITLIMPAGANGKLYGAVTNQTIADELGKLGFEIERKRIDVPGLTLKNIGKYSVAVKLYESLIATISVVVEAQVENSQKTSTKATKKEKKQDTISQDEVSEPEN